MDSITISPQRTLGTIQIDCAIEETHTDTLTITEHPVEQGAAIADHAYRNPAEVVLRIGFSNSSARAGGNEGYVRQKYADLLALQLTREPFKIITGKRAYKNMLIRSLGVTTDEKTDATLLCTATCREIILVQSQVTALGAASAQASPQKTAAPLSLGKIQALASSLSPSAVLAGAVAGGLPSFSKVLEVPLKAAAQAFSVDLGGVTYGAQVLFHDVAQGGWALDLADAAGKALVQGLPLVTGGDLLGQFAHLGIAGQLIMQTDHDIDAVPTFDNLGQAARLFFASL